MIFDFFQKYLQGLLTKFLEMFLISEVFLQTAYPGTVLRKVFKTFYWKEFEQATRQPVRSTGHNFFLTIWSLFKDIAKKTKFAALL